MYKRTKIILVSILVILLVACIAIIYINIDNRGEGQENVNKSEIKNKNVLLIDDILTTGSTIVECTELLLENGAMSVSAAVLASGRKDF